MIVFRFGAALPLALAGLVTRAALKAASVIQEAPKRPRPARALDFCNPFASI
jgi:hypothetical protein